MLDDNGYASVLDTICRAQTMSELQNQLNEIRDLYRVANIVYHALHVPNAKRDHPILLLTYDPHWVSLYTDNDYFKIDPVVKMGRVGFLPVDWQNVDRESATARSFFAKADSYGVGRNGISFPIRGANGDQALFTVTSNVSTSEWNTSRIAYVRDFQMIGHYIHKRALELSCLCPQQLMRKPSRRELQCLSGVSQGLTPKQIAADFHISESAVRLYLHSIRTKLGCLTVAQAVGIAIQLNIIHS
jgi:DNA-binding CsgD family transcriptional regulator